MLEALADAGAGAGAVAIRGEARSRAGSPACGGSRCARSPSAPPAARCRSAARAPRRSCGSRRAPEGGRSSSAAGCVAICESGLRPLPRRDDADAAPRRSRCALPGRGAGRRLGGPRRASSRARSSPAGPDLATLDAEALAGRIEVRTWREGDRIRPLGMEGTKTLQDLFTDRGVPRSLRATLPVVTVGGEVAWVAGRRGLGATSGSTPDDRARSRCSAARGRARLAARRTAPNESSSLRRVNDPAIGEILVAAEDLQRAGRRARRARSAATTRVATW